MIKHQSEGHLMVSINHKVIDEINSLYDHFNEYIHTFELDVEGASSDESGRAVLVTINYMSWAYDLIDSDLDFDETSYMAILSEFDRFLDIYAVDLVSGSEVNVEVRIKKMRMLFRHEWEVERMSDYRKAKKKVLLTTCEWR